MRSRDEVLNAAQRQLNRDPFKSLAELANGMGVARGTLYRYFETRESLLHEIVERAVTRWEYFHANIDTLAASSSDDPVLVASRVRELLLAYMKYPEDWGLSIFNHTLGLHPELRKRERDIAVLEELLLKNGQRLRVLRSDVPALWLSSTIWGLIIGARDAHRDGDAAPNMLAKLVVTTFLEGCSDRSNADVWQTDAPPRF